MKKIIAILFLLSLVCPAMAQAPDKVAINYTLSATGAAATIPGTYLYHAFSVNVIGGTLSACNIDLEGSDDATNWSNVIAAHDCSTKGVATTTYSLYKYFRPYINAYAVGTGTPVLEYVYYGYMNQSSSATMQGVVSYTASAFADGSTQTARLATDASIITSEQGLVSTANPTYADGTLQIASYTTSGAKRVEVVNISSDIAEGSAVTSQAPVTVGAQAVADDKTAVDAGASVRAVADLNGKLITSPYTNLELWKSATGSVTSTTESDIVAADASYRFCITSLVVYNSSATDTTLALYSGGSGGTLLGTYPAPAKGGVSVSMPSPMCTAAVNTKLTIDEADTANAVYATLTYFKVKR